MAQGIEYVEIRSKNTRELVGIVDTASSIIWHRKYYEPGFFEVYAPCTSTNLSLLTAGNYVTRYDCVEVGIIESVEVLTNLIDGRMISARGRFAKSILDRRIIYRRSGYSVSPTILSGSVETAARSLVSQNAIDCVFDAGRNMAELALAAHANTAPLIVDESGNRSRKQVTYENLLTYTDSLLKEYGLGAYCGLSADRMLVYTVFAGVDRSMGNSAGNSPVIFSQDFDNLLTSNYAVDVTMQKNTALIGGAGEGVARFCAILKNTAVTGAARREVFVDASSHSNVYTDDAGATQTIDDTDYNTQLKTIGRQKLAEYTIVETFNGTFDMTGCSFVYRTDFSLGDIVTVQDVGLGLYINPRILEVLESQDMNGYTVSAVYGK